MRSEGASVRAERTRGMPWGAAVVVLAFLGSQPLAAAQPVAQARQGTSVSPAAVLPTLVADDGLSASATSRYVLDARRTTVEASVSIELRNVAPDDGDVFYYFDAFAVPVPAGARSVRARSDGSTLDVSLRRTEDPSTRLARISFPDLLFGRSRTIELTFEVPGEPPRSADSTRVGPGYATFAVYGVGDPGRSAVEVVAPSSMRFDATSDEFTAAENGTTTTHTSSATDSEGGFWAVVSLRDPTAVDERAVDVAGTSLLLSGYPDDTRWLDFVAARVVEGIPALERLVATPWPGGLERIREDASPTLRGYDGWFDPSDDEIVIGERLDEDLLFHELSHAWVSGESFDQRWVSEGLAQVLAERAVAATGGTPREQPQVSRGDSDAVALNAWGASAGSRSADVDAYAYPAAHAATTALLGELDDAQLAAVAAAGIRGERAYDPPGTPDAEGGRTSWQRWLDLLQGRAGVAGAPQVFARWALTEEEQALLAPRDQARAAYAQLDEADGSWLPPEGLRDAMTAWDFERAAVVQGRVAPLAPAVSDVQDAARRAGLDVPDEVRSMWETAEQDEQYAALARSLPVAATTVRAVGRARAVAAQDRGPLSELGASILGVDDRAADALALLEEGRLDAASDAASDATGRADRAVLVGLALPVVALLVLVVGLLAGRRVAARRRRRWAARPGADDGAGMGGGVGAGPVGAGGGGSSTPSTPVIHAPSLAALAGLEAPAPAGPAAPEPRHPSGDDGPGRRGSPAPPGSS